MLLTAVVARRATAAEAAVENLVGAGRALVVDTMRRAVVRDTMRRAVVRDTKRRARRVFCMLECFVCCCCGVMCVDTGGFPDCSASFSN